MKSQCGVSHHLNLDLAIIRLALLQGHSLNREEMHQHQSDVMQSPTPEQALTDFLVAAEFKNPKWISGHQLENTKIPALIYQKSMGWGVLRGSNSMGIWIADVFDDSQNQWVESPINDIHHHLIAQVNTLPEHIVSSSKTFQLIRHALSAKKNLLFDVAIGGVVINAVALATSLYSMQVYDRVVPTAATGTLLALTLGVFGAIAFELALKYIRSGINERIADEIDQFLSRVVYKRFLSIRLDQLPNSVGSLSGQLRGYETVRGFLAALVTQMSVDMPFALIYTLVFASVAGWLALVPAVFLCVSLVVGLAYRHKIDQLTKQSTQASHFKTGLLVETVEGAETIKSGNAGWRMLSRWLQVSDDARSIDLKMRHAVEHSQYLIAALHQSSYVVLVALGAMMVAKGEITMGSLIACSILSGRILAPIGSIPHLLIQWGQCKNSLQSLDRLFALETDSDEVDMTVQLDLIKGNIELEQILFSYGSQPALVIPKLNIRAGEKIGVLGPIGAGKTSFLRLLSGMYHPQQGSIKLDGVNVHQISKTLLSEKIGFLQQDGRLFAGTVRENLILGLIDPGDQKIIDAAIQTGLQESVLKRTKLGLQHRVHEGGQGLSGGQRQLVNLTRIFLRKPRIWLLDEPTASMDRGLENHIIQAIKSEVKPEDVLVLVTHKPELLQLVDRLVVIAGHQIVLDGPKNEVLNKLTAGSANLNSGQS